MSVQVKHRRDTAANIAAFTPAQGELIVDTTNNRVVVGDGSTAGGWPAAKLTDISSPSRTAVADANYTVLTTDKNVAYTAITAARAVTLPSAASYQVGQRLTIFDESGSASATNTITVNRAGSDTINGATSAVISSAYGVLAMESNGANKWTLTDQATSNLTAVGVGTPADPSNPLSVYGGSALFNGSNFSFTVNKSGSGNVASVIFEDGFSLRAQIGLLNNDNFSFKVSPNGSSYSTGLVLDSGTGAVTLGNARTAVANASYTALTTDREIAYTSLLAAQTVTLPAAASFPAGHPLVIVDESGGASLINVLTIAAAGTDTINGRASATVAMAYGYCRLVSDGSSRWTTVGRSAVLQVFSSSGTYTPTPGMTTCAVYLLGGGGGGGGGARQASGSAVSGGGGGGAGGARVGTFTASQITSSQTVTIGAGGSAGAAATTDNTAGGGGGAGGNTSFGSRLTAFGGGGGAGGRLAQASGGGGGGGALGAGGSTTTSVAGAAGAGGGGGGGSGSAGSDGVDIGGSGGAGSSATGASANSGVGPSSASGGGSGGGVTGGGSAQNGGASGDAGSAGTGASGGSGAGSAGTSPSLSSRALALYVGTGGAGGAGGLSGGFAGGAGGSPGGGGGGGGSTLNTFSAGAGGAGGAGYCIVLENF